MFPNMLEPIKTHRKDEAPIVCCQKEHVVETSQENLHTSNVRFQEMSGIHH